MNLTDMRTLVRRDLRDEATPYRWSNDELDRHIQRALKEFSERIPLTAMATLVTTADSRELDISSLVNRVLVFAVEYPVAKFPKQYQHFSLWVNTLTLLGDEVPDGSNCYIYYGKLHTLDADTSTIPTKYEDLVATGGTGYAAISAAIYSTDRVSVGGIMTPREYLTWGKERLSSFKDELKRLGRRQTVRTSQLYKPIL